jgi:HSP20 family molecular chaperone IbpA
MADPNAQCPVYINLFEKPEQYELQASVPGCSKDDVRVLVTESKSIVSISAERKRLRADEAGEKQGEWIVQERPMGKMQRLVAFSNDADLARADAEVKVSLRCR